MFNEESLDGQQDAKKPSDQVITKKEKKKASKLEAKA